RRFYGGFLAWVLEHRLTTLAVTLIFIVGSCFLFPYVGRDFFPAVDAGQIRLHVRAPAGTRLEETERYFADVEQFLRERIPPIDVQILGPKSAQETNREIAEDLRNQIAGVPGAVDVHVHQVSKTPELRVVVDRTRADQLGMSQRDVASDLLVSLSSSGQTAPN